MKNPAIVAVAVIFGLICYAYSASDSYHGGTFLAMAGKDSVILASDSRFSSYQTGPFLLGSFPRCIFRVGSKTLVGFYGLDSDARSIMDKIRLKVSDHLDYQLGPSHISRVISDELYRSGLICCPIIVGMEDSGSPYICSMDGLGAQTISDTFAVSGTANAALYAICESTYRPGLDAEELVNIAEYCLRSALVRDVMSGCSIRILTLRKGEIYEKIVDIADA
jgi:20S proteasome subunit beta 3